MTTDTTRRSAVPEQGALRAVTQLLDSAQFAQAAQSCHALLTRYPHDADVRHLYGRCLAAQGRLGEATREFASALASVPLHFASLVDLGVAHLALGRPREARAPLEAAARIDERPAELHYALGVCALELGDLEAAEHSLREALDRNPQFAYAHNNLGVVLDRRGRLGEAIACFRRATRLDGNFADAWRNLGGALLRENDAPGAVEAFRHLCALLPDAATAHAALGTALLAAGDLRAARPSLERALQLNPHLADAAANLGLALQGLQQPEEALGFLQRALQVDPNLPEARVELGRLLAARGESAAALAELRAAAQALLPADARLALRVASAMEEAGSRHEALAVLQRARAYLPQDAELCDALGQTLHRSGQPQEAVHWYQQAAQLDNSRSDYLLHLGQACEQCGAYAEARAAFERALRAPAAAAAAAAGIASCALRTCDWATVKALTERLQQSAAGLDALAPFLLLALELEPALVADALRRRSHALTRQFPRKALARHTNRRLRIAYVSPDFREHAVAHCIAGVLERHARERFEVIGVSLSAPDRSAIGARIRAACDGFLEGDALADAEIVRHLREREIDIAVDLAGFTTGARPEIFARGLAPVQVGYLGFPGSTGGAYLDYLVADACVVPHSDAALYGERILRLPHSYLPFDDRRALPPPLSRSAAGLPESGLVFCGFSNAYKISAPQFAAWLTLLREVPASVLWLRSMGETAHERLREAAQAQGVEPQRLVFAPFAPSTEAHLARLQLADQFLDTLPYNAHSSAAEALWVGVPVLSCRGRTFAGRVGASLLGAVDLPQLICEDFAGYTQRAVELARSPDTLRQLRAHLHGVRSDAALFATERYTRDLEALWSAVCR